MRRATAGGLGRLVVALLVAPFGAYLGVLAASVVNAALGVPAGTGLGLATKSQGAFVLALPLLVATWPPLVALAALVGLPAHLLLVAMRLRRSPSYGAAGAAAGAVFAATALPRLMHLPQSSPGAAGLAFFGAAAGAGSALVFWAALRPDRQRV